MNCFTDNTNCAAQIELVFRAHHAADVPSRDAKLALLEAAMAAVTGLTEDALTDLILAAATIRDDLRDAAGVTAPTEAEAEIAEIRQMGETE